MGKILLEEFSLFLQPQTTFVTFCLLLLTLCLFERESTLRRENFLWINFVSVLVASNLQGKKNIIRIVSSLSVSHHQGKFYAYVNYQSVCLVVLGIKWLSLCYHKCIKMQLPTHFVREKTCPKGAATSEQFNLLGFKDSFST